MRSTEASPAVAISDHEPGRTPSTPYGVPWTMGGLVSAHKRGSLVIAVLCVAVAAYMTLIALSPGARPISDHTTCEQWASANIAQQDAYAKRYVSEHGNVAAAWGPAPKGVINAINAGCYQAYGEDVADRATMLQAVARTF